MEIHCGNLPFSFDDNQLRSVFSPFGKVESSEIVLHKFSDKPRGFGFVKMPNNEEAKIAITTLDGTEIEGRTIRVSEARPQRKFGEVK